MTSSTEAPVPNAQESRDAALKASYVTATKQLREAHLEEFNTLRQAAAKDLGFEWTPPKTKEQKAEEELAALLEQYPHLREKAAGSGTTTA